MDAQTSLTAMVQKVETLKAEMATDRAAFDERKRSLESQIRQTQEAIKMAGAGIDLDRVECAEKVIFAGEYSRSGDDGPSALNAAIVELSTRAGDSLFREFIGTKSYDRWHGQRCDCEYGFGPRHGSIIFRIGLTDAARKRGELTPEEIEDAVYYLVNLSRIQDARRKAA